MNLLIHFIVYTLIAAACPQFFPNIKVKGLGSAATVAVVFGILNLLIGWFLTFLLRVLTFPVNLLTLGLFSLLLPTIINAILLKLTDVFVDSFELKGWTPAFIMGLLFAIGGYLAARL